MSLPVDESAAREIQCKLMQERVNNVEQHFGNICSAFAGYTRNVAKLRDKGDDVARSLFTYAQNESYNQTTKSALIHFAENLSAVQDYRNAEMQRLEARVIQPLTVYGTSCKQVKLRLKEMLATNTKERKKKRVVERLALYNKSSQLSQAQSVLQQASVDAANGRQQAEEETVKFEQKKLDDIKNVMVEFVSIEMMFHTKALEMYTQCYHSLSLLHQDEDLEEFRNMLHPPAAQQRSDQQQKLNAGRRPETGTRTKERHPAKPNGDSLRSGTLKSNNLSLVSSARGETIDGDDNDEISDEDDEDNDDDDDDDDDDEEEEEDEDEEEDDGPDANSTLSRSDKRRTPRRS